ncbi:IgGFc-binding protein-like [Salvelinus fontinalis]|uniref:IgGFc-binding protein-like n=1 Tax=Salvelinus fontinalis TaxID=8038 RepID=UPI002484FB9B|nr:IgGFc-binding protein-like [Salvelinus fontinalis]
MPTQTGTLHAPPWCPLHHLRLHEGGYEVASDQTSAQWFRVVVDVCSNGAYTNVTTVYVFFKYVTVNSQHNTWVNGQNVSLPSTPAKQLSVNIANRTVVIERDSGVRVTYSISQELFVTVDNHLAGKVCGACDNYHGIVKDDMTTANGKSYTDATVIVGYWWVGDFSSW